MSWRVSDDVVVSVVGALPATLAVVFTYWRQRRKLRQVHDLVNSAHTAALDEIRQLRELVAQLSRVR